MSLKTYSIENELEAIEKWFEMEGIRVDSIVRI